MKKFIYLAVFVVLCSIASSCTEENIAPQTTGGTGTETVKF